MNALLAARELKQHYPVKGGFLRPDATLKAVDGVDLALSPGKTLAVVGESGSGKSTLARMVTRIEPPTSGALEIDGIDVIAGIDRSQRRHLRRTVQMIFQDPFGSLNPRKQVGTILEEPLVINTKMSAAERSERSREVMVKVGLRPEHYRRYPRMFSAGQRQRIAIARALMLDPKIVVADEPISGLDLSVQAQVLNLMMDLQEEFQLAYMVFSHDLRVVRHIANEVLVLYLGRTVEQGPKQAIFDAPQHPYTIALLGSTPSVDPDHRRGRVVLKGEMPSPFDPPSGCAFHGRCPYATDLCAKERPVLREVAGHAVACHHAEAIGG